MKWHIPTARIMAAVACTVLLAAMGCATEIDGEEDPTLDEAYGGDHHDDGVPVIFVQPCAPPGLDYQAVSAMWQPFINHLKTKGWPSSYLINWVPNVGSPVCYSTHDLAIKLRDKVQQVRSQFRVNQVDLVGASGGVLTIRYYMATLGGVWYVRNVVSLDAPNHGTEFGINGGDLQAAFGAPNYEQMKETYIPYACQGQTFFGQSRDIQLAINGCLTPTGRTVWRDETPGWSRYLAIRNLLDDQIFPNESACLNMNRQNDCSSSVNRSVSVPAGPCPFPPAGNMCPAHVNPIFDPGTWDIMCRHLGDDGKCEFDD